MQRQNMVDRLLGIVKKTWRNFFNAQHIFEAEVMKLRFDKFTTPKIRYDIRKKFFTLTIKTKDDIFKYLFFILMFTLLFLLPYFSIDIGISQREWHHVQSLNNEYYDEHQDFSKTHPQAIDNWVSFVSHGFGGRIDDIALRHVISSLFGWGIIFIVGFFLVHLFSWRTAFMGSVFLAISPRFIGLIMGNLSDTAFAFAYLFFIFQLYLFIKELPLIKWKRLILIVLSILLATSIHVGGFLLIFYLLLFPILYFFITNPIRKFFSTLYFFNFIKLLILLFIISTIVYVANALYLPEVYASSLINPFQALTLMTENTPLVTQLFEGKLITSSQAPSYYLIKYFFITTPFVILIGLTLFFIVLRTCCKKTSIFNTFLLFFALFYPLIFITKMKLNVYEDFSQHLFLYPFIILLSAAGVESLLLKINDKYTNPAIVGFLALLSLMPLRHILVNHPFETLYFNEISGGIPNAYGVYEIDVHQISGKVGAEEFVTYFNNDTNRNMASEKEWIICTDGGETIQRYFSAFAPKIKIISCQFDERYQYPWDYFISFAYQLPAYQLKHGLWPPMNSSYTILIEGKPIVAFIKNDDVIEETEPLF